jgi:hypothetical protein
MVEGQGGSASDQMANGKWQMAKGTTPAGCIEGASKFELVRASFEGQGFQHGFAWWRSVAGMAEVHGLSSQRGASGERVGHVEFGCCWEGERPWERRFSCIPF